MPSWSAAGPLRLEHHAVTFPLEEVVASEIVVDFLTISVGGRLDPHRKRRPVFIGKSLEHVRVEIDVRIGAIR